MTTVILIIHIIISISIVGLVLMQRSEGGGLGIGGYDVGYQIVFHYIHHKHF